MTGDSVMFGWFKKKLRIHTPEGRTGRVPEAQVDKWIREGHLKPLVEVIINDIDEGEKTVHWVVGEDVDRETYERLKDEGGRLHVLTVNRNGDKEAYITTRENYEGAREAATTAFEPNALRERAETGDASAQIGLGLLYSEGTGVPQDDAEAAKWYRKAAEQNDADAQMYLGILYAEGRGVSQDFVHAYMWLSLAAIQGNTDAVGGRDLAATEMTAEQIAVAQKLAREWKPQTVRERRR
jgi:hypothetical protein